MLAEQRLTQSEVRVSFNSDAVIQPAMGRKMGRIG
jgi:hypothetical protein